MINTAPMSTLAPGSQVKSAPATVISAALQSSRRPRCSRNTSAARITVAGSSVFNRIDAVAALVRARPATSSTGPTAPPATIATSAGFHSESRAAPEGGRRTTAGSTAMAAPR